MEEDGATENPDFRDSERARQRPKIARKSTRFLLGLKISKLRRGYKLETNLCVKEKVFCSNYLVFYIDEAPYLLTYYKCNFRHSEQQGSISFEIRKIDHSLTTNREQKMWTIPTMAQSIEDEIVGVEYLGEGLLWIVLKK